MIAACFAHVLSAVQGAEGIAPPPALAIYFFYVEGIGYTIALLFFFYTFVRRGPLFYDWLAKWVDGRIIDDFYHKYFPGAVDYAYRWLFRRFETGVVDEGYNWRVVDGVLGLGRQFGRIQTGRVNHYLIALAFGVVFFLAVLFGMGL